MKRYDLLKKEIYTKDGVEKTAWKNVGTMVEFDNGGKLVEIPAIGLKANAFEKEEKNKGFVLPYKKSDKAIPDEVFENISQIEDNVE